METDFTLHPEFVEDIVEDLLAKDVISKNKVDKLKNDSYKHMDPSIMMGVRQKEIRKESLVEISRDKTTLLKRKEETTLKTTMRVKDLKVIDKEIANTKRKLVTFQNQLEKKNESLANDILDLEKVREQDTNSPLLVNLNEDETKHYFNLHLDHLEGSVVQSTPKTWKPYEVKPAPVINVITTMKVLDFKQPTISFDEEELKMLAMCDLKPIHITGKTFQAESESQKPKEEVRNVVPSNTPLLQNPNISETSPNELLESADVKEEDIALKVIKRWRLFVKTKMSKRLEEERKKQLMVQQMNVFFNAWMSQVKKRKAERKMNSHSAFGRNSATVCIHKNSKEPSKGFHTRRSLELKQNSLEPTFASNPVNLCSKNIKTEALTSVRNIQMENEGISVNNKANLIKVEDLKVQHKVLTLEGLESDHPIHKSDKEQFINIVKIYQVKQKASSGSSSKSNREPFKNRFAAQEKIIANQLNIIKQQNQLILDLKAENLKTQSNFSLKMAENELAKTSHSFDKKLQPLVRTVVSATSGRVEKPKFNDVDSKFDALTKSMFERNEYCKQLAEMTKMRKLRIEEERKKLKAEEEEKQRLEIEEQKRQRYLKIQIEKQLAQEKARNFQATKEHLSKLTTIAVNHHRHLLLTKTFKALKSVLSELRQKTCECNNIYRRKLMKRALSGWRGEVRQALASKNQSATNYYSMKLVERYWNAWRRLQQEYMIKVQVSEDMFALKLQERMFRRWSAFTACQYLQTCCKMELAERLYRKKMLKRTFSHWREVPLLMFAEREKEQRRRAWRQAVQELIPDFSPVFAEHLQV